jgi:hypothetical protein
MLNTHMPFLTCSLDNERVFLFCQADEKHIWKIFVSINDGDPIRIDTGFSDEVIECSPAAWQDETGWHLSFIAGGEIADPLYHLYRMDGKTFETLSHPVAMRPTKTGFIYLDRIVTGTIQDIINIHEPGGDKIIELPNAYIYRVSYRADNADSLIISGQWIGDDEIFSIEYNLKTDEQEFIECDGKIAYKPTIYGNEILYADRVGESFESRRICQAKQSHHKKCHIASLRQFDNIDLTFNQPTRCRCKNKASENNDDVSRQSCIECVEKHVGAAFVIASEIHDGYAAQRLRLIGHLHEAEDESQEFLELHNLIRQARKEYQKNNSIPNWELLSQKIEEMNQLQKPNLQTL